MLANDTVTVKTRAKVRVLRVSGPVRARVTGKNIAVRALPKATAGTYRVKYRVSDVRGKWSTAVILVRVTARRGNNTGETPETGNTTPALPAVMEPPGPPVVTNITCQSVGSDVTFVVYHWQVSDGRYTNYDMETGEKTRITDGQTVTGVATAHVRLPIEVVRAQPSHQIIGDSYQQFIAPLNWTGWYPSETTALAGNPQPESIAAISHC